MSDRAPLTSVQRPFGRPITGWRLRVYAIIFETDTRAGRLFDLTLPWLILARVGVVMADAVASLHARWGAVFKVLERGFTALFTLEHLLRLACVRRPKRRLPASAATAAPGCPAARLPARCARGRGRCGPAAAGQPARSPARGGAKTAPPVRALMRAGRPASRRSAQRPRPG